MPQPMPQVEPEPEPEPVVIPNWLPPETWGTSDLVDMNDDPNIVEVNLRAEVMQVKLTEDLSFEAYGYNGMWPGPNLHAKVGDEIIVHFENKLPEPTTVHWHGLRIPADMDGTPRVQTPVEAGGTFTYRFVVPDSGTYWYHPHVRTNEQVEKGLYGSIIIRETEMPTLNAERMFVLDDILVGATNISPFLRSRMEGVHGRNGNLLLINGQTEAQQIDVEQNAVEMWRVVNTANARTMIIGIEGAQFEVIGTDGGRLAEPYTTDRIVLPVGQRYDFFVRYDRSGTARLVSYVQVLNENDQVVEAPIDMAVFNVMPSSLDYQVVSWSEVPARPARTVDREVTIDLDADTSGPDLAWTINGAAHPDAPLFTFTEGETIKMTIVNHAGPEHPFHLHGQFFEVLSRDGEPGLKDTVLIRGNETVEIIAYIDNPGEWMAHCHILEHAELGMMGVVKVLPAE